MKKAKKGNEERQNGFLLKIEKNGLKG